LTLVMNPFTSNAYEKNRLLTFSKRCVFGILYIGPMDHFIWVKF
jgi:hypothetical protein